MQHPEYNRDTNPYPSYGKRYNSEPAVISLTSWRARINTVSKTLFSLLKQCPGFHIVLVLSEEEFPKMMDELPENLKLFVENELVEVLWVYRNYRSFKKVFFTMDKYRDVPVISADDDCLYNCNYAKMLYDKWVQNKGCVYTFCKDRGSGFQHGPSTLYYGDLFRELAMKYITQVYPHTNHDDWFYGSCLKKLGIPVIEIRRQVPYVFHDTIDAMSRRGNYGSAVGLCKRLLGV